MISLRYMIEVTGLTKAYGQRLAVQDLTFQVAPGEVYALLGPNGAGKTTTLRVLSTLIRPTQGRIRVAGFDVVQDPLEVRRRLGLVNGGMRVYDRLTGREVLRFFAGFYGLEGQAFQEALDWVTGLLQMEETLDRRVLEMSTGMRQKVVIARAILHRPPRSPTGRGHGGAGRVRPKSSFELRQGLPPAGQRHHLLHPRDERGGGGGGPGELFAPGPAGL